MADKNDQTVEGLEGSEPLEEQPKSLPPEDEVADGNTGGHEPPLRSVRPDEPVLKSLATGAGQHVPTAITEDSLNSETGRFIQPGDEEDVVASSKPADKAPSKS